MEAEPGFQPETDIATKPMRLCAVQAGSSAIFGLTSLCVRGYPMTESPPTLPRPASSLEAPSTSPEPDARAWAVYGQVTNVTQWHRPFRSPYSGPNSLDANGRTEETTDATLYAGLRLWRGAELCLNPEIDQGFGLSNTVGVAGFPSGEA